MNALAQPFDVSVQAISRHLRVQEDAGLITRGRVAAQFRPCRFDAAPLDNAVAWMDDHCAVVHRDIGKPEHATSLELGGHNKRRR